MLGRSGEEDAAEDVRNETLLSLRLMARRFPMDGCEFEDALFGPARQQAKDIAQVGPGLDRVHLAAGQEGDEGRVGFGSLVAAEEEPVLRPMTSRRSAFSLALL